ncbi:MAG TPA: hypothetical protein VMI35_01570, partial [Puia sp.]|nr:hypothetical protein [Puia sp.]
EDYISAHAKKDFSKIFDQYLRTVQIPELEYKLEGHTLSCRWTNCIKGFNMPLKIHFNGDNWVTPTEDWQRFTLRPGSDMTLTVDRNFYIGIKQVN